MMLPRTVALLLLALVPGCRPTGGTPAQQPDDTTYAVRLLAQAGVVVDRSAIERVLRDSLETVVWVGARLRGVPVFDRQVGYVFDPGDATPVILGEPLPAAPVALDDRPRVTADEARAAFRRRAVSDRWVIAPDDPLQAVLGYVVESRPRPYVLAWRVRPVAAGVQVVVVDATTGREISWDSGIRCARAPCP